MKFPEFIIIGFMKCGSTSLWHNMKQHPFLTMCKQKGGGVGSGIKFWEGPNKKKGMEWYKGLFSGNMAGEKALYGHSAKSMEAISKHIPNVKLIVSMRNPVDRGYSEYQMSVRRRKNRTGKNSEPYNFHTGSSKFGGKGKYMELIQQNLLPFFPKENIHFVISEWMRTDMNKTMNEIYDFLGVDEFHCGVESFESPTGIKKSDNPVHASRNEYQSWVSQYEPLKGGLRQRLLDFHARDNEELFEFLGYSVPEWQL